MLAIHQALIHLNTKYTARSKAVIYTDSQSSLYLLFSRHPTSYTPLKHHSFPSNHWDGESVSNSSHSNIRANNMWMEPPRQYITFPLPCPSLPPHHLIIPQTNALSPLPVALSRITPLPITLASLPWIYIAKTPPRSLGCGK